MDERIWTDEPLKPQETLSIRSSEVRHAAAAPAAYLITGQITEALAKLAPAAPCLGLAEQAPDGSFAIRISRDTVLLITETELSCDMGWQDGGFALSDARDACTPLALNGPDAEEVVSLGGVSVPLNPSPSAAVAWAGIIILLTGRQGGYTFWVPSAYLTYATEFLRNCASS